MAGINLWNVNISQHGMFEFSVDEKRQCDENEQSQNVKPSVHQWVSVEDTHLIDHIIMPQWKQLCHSFEHGIHRKEWISSSTRGKAQYAP